MMDESEAGPTGDVIFHGDVLKWKKFANSLLMQMAIQLSNKYPDPSGKAATEFVLCFIFVFVLGPETLKQFV